MSCNNCPLKGSIKVLGSGNKKAKILCIGEAPGFHETVERKPFVGPAGQELNKALSAAGISRSDIYCTNTILCRPPENATPTVSMINCCKQRLQTEIKNINPEVIVCLGSIASRAYLNVKTLDLARGRVFSINGSKIISTFHPARILRQWELEPLLIRDLSNAKELLNGFKKERQRYAVIENINQFRKLMSYLSKAEVFSLDSETSSFDFLTGKILCLQFSTKAGEGFCVPLYGYKLREIWTKQEKQEIIASLRDLLGSNIPKVMANAKFDIKFLHRLGINIGGIIWDTMLMHHLVDEDVPHSQEQISIQYLPLGFVDGYKEISDRVHSMAPKRTDTFADIPEDLLHYYGCYDVDAGIRLYHVLKAKLQKESLLAFYLKLVYPLEIAVTRMEERGVLIDRQKLEAASLTLSKKIEAKQKELEQIAGEPFNPRSTKQLAKIFAKLNMTPTLKTEKGNPSFNKESLESLSKKHTLPKAILELRGLEKLKSTYVDGSSGDKGIKVLLDKNSRVHPSYLIHGTSTGRTSSNKPNFQNIPREPSEIRAMFVAPKGWKFIEADFEKAELNVAAYITKDKNLINRLQGDDFHTYTARAVGICKPNAIPNKEQRNRSKMLSFGILFAGSPEGIASRINVSQRKAIEFSNKFFMTYPVLGRWMEKQRSLVARDNFVIVNPFGRRRHFSGLKRADNMIRGRVSRQSINFPIQSTSSDILSFATIRIDERLKGFKAGIVGSVHDCLFLEVPGKEVLEVLKIVKEEMERFIPELNYSPKVDIRVSDCWGGKNEIDKYNA